MPKAVIYLWNHVGNLAGSVVQLYLPTYTKDRVPHPTTAPPVFWSKLLESGSKPRLRGRMLSPLFSDFRLQPSKLSVFPREVPQCAQHGVELKF